MNIPYEDESLRVIFKKEGNNPEYENKMRTCSIVVTVKNEAPNIASLYNNLHDLVENNNQSQKKLAFPFVKEIIIVDGGSTDGTIDILGGLADRIRSFTLIVIKQPLNTKLAYAEYCGAMTASGDYIVKMDGDGQHDVSTAIDMLKNASNYDIVIASRHIEDGGSKWKPIRGVISRAAKAEFHALFPRLWHVKDPLSGFFLCKRDALPKIPPNKNGFKYLLHILALKPGLRVLEVPFIIQERSFGQSKIAASARSMVLNYNRELIYCYRLHRKALRKYSE